MAAHFSFLLFLTGLTGIYSLTTVSQVSVKAGGLITIPCHYDSKYRNHIKYLCKGYYQSSCSYAIKTGQPHNSGKFSISDNKSQGIFNVTINQLTGSDEHYWCFVEIDGGIDDGRYFHLSVTKGTPTLRVDRQQITGFKGHDVNINCYYRNPGEIKWCRLGGRCVTGSGRLTDGTAVTINASVPNVFTVTMSGLATVSSNWYYCVKGDLQVPVHITVTDNPITTTTIPFTSAPTDASGNLQQGASFKIITLIIPLSLLLFILTVTLFICFMLKRHRKNNKEPSAAVKNTLSESDADVVYSSVTIKPPKVKSVETEANDVTYSTLAELH